MLILLPVMLIFAAFAINLAYVELAKTELVVAADAAARAGGRELMVGGSVAAARAAAIDLAASNTVAHVPLQLSTSDVSPGISTRPTQTSRYNFTPTTVNPNSIRVSAHRDALNANGPIPLLMPNFLGTTSVSTSHQATSTQLEVDIALVVDRSGSMAYAADETADPTRPPYSAPPGWVFGNPAPPICRWRDLVTAVGVFTSALSASPADELLSLSSYGTTAITDLSLTSDYTLVPFAMSMYTASFNMGATNIGGGIQEGAAALAYSPNQRPGAAKVLIVLTDGIHNTGTDPIWAADQAAQNGAMLFTVTFAMEADQWLMDQVATRGSGKHFHATTASELAAVFQAITKSLPTLLTK